MSWALREQREKRKDVPPLDVLVNGEVIGELTTHKHANGQSWFLCALKAEILTPVGSGDSQAQAIQRAILNSLDASRKVAGRMGQIAMEIGLAVPAPEDLSATLCRAKQPED